MGCVRAVAWAWSLATALAAAEPPSGPAGVPFGHADWRPSPTDPVGFAGQGCNWYPGATPPTEFWEGTPVETEVKDANGKSSRQWSYADRKSKNILWKVPVPGWSDSLPIVVGNRVISLTSPHYVTCYDADTGKVLWQDQLKFMSLPLLGKDRKTIEPAPGAAQGATQQDLFERTLGWVRARLGATAVNRDYKGVVDWEPRKELITQVIRDLERWQGELKASYPDIGPTLDAEIAALRRCLEPKPDAAPPAGMKEYRIRRYAGHAPRTWSAGLDLIGYAGEKLGLQADTVFCNYWQGCISDTMATPVSDGEIVGVTFGHGQIAAYEVATGKRLWAWRDPLLSACGASHCQSPLLWKDLVIVPGGGRSVSGKGKAGPNDYTMTMIGVDKRTGVVRWESSRGPGGCPPSGTHGDHMSPYLLRLPDGKGGVRAVVIANQGAVLDAETGAALAQMPDSVGGDKKGYSQWGSGFIGASGSRLYKAFGADNFTPPADSWPLAFEDGKLAVGPGLATDVRGSAHGPFAISATTLALGGHLVDPATGKKQAVIPRFQGRAAGSPVLAGTGLILKQEYGSRNERGDRMFLAIFSHMDVQDPAKPVLLTKLPNLVGDSTMPTDIADTYFPDLKKPEFKRWCLGGYLGIRSGFGVDTSGVTCHGSRLYFKSQTHLYCIGEK